MKTLILNGSPRANGDTASLIKELTKKLPGEYKIVNAYQCEYMSQYYWADFMFEDF